MKIAHIADTHVRNFKYHKEYRAIFDKMYETLKEEAVDLIVHCGDLAHTKTQLSPEYFDLAASFLQNLADIAPTYIILGNHDGNLKNERRQDAITPIVKALQHKDLHLLKNAGEVQVGDITLNVLSVFDEENWVEPSDESKINIGLYHGAISGVKTDTGWTMTHGDHPIEVFQPFDFVFLGDIHKTNQIIDHEGRIRYPGSTVQQNFGETNDKGFLLWDIQSKDDFTCKHIAIPNPKPFITINLTPTGRMPRGLDIPKGCRLRLVSNNNLSLEAMRRAKEVAQHRFKPDTISFLNRAAGERGNIEELANSIHQDNMRDPVVQEELIREYLSDFQVEEDLMKKVLNLNAEYIKKAEETEEISRNIKWNLRELQWSNLFNYGEGNRIDFDSLCGTVGIFGKNYSGKSSVIDSLLFTLFNTTSKKERKNVNIINQNREEGTGEVVISIGEEQYYISRTSTKYIKRLKGEETLEAKTDLNFYKIDKDGEKVSLNGLTRNDTDRNIRKVFGSIEDFLLTSLSSQLDSLSFIREGSTERKKIVAKFLDLEIFEKKFRLAKDDAADLKGALRRAGDRDYDEEIKEAEADLYEAEKELIVQEAECRTLASQVQELTTEVSKLTEKIDSAPSEPIDIVEVRKKLKRQRILAHNAKNNIKENELTISQNKVLVHKMSAFLENFDIDDLTQKEKQFAILLRQISHLEDRITDVRKKKELLTKVPCGDSFPSCMFIKDAVSSSTEEEKLLADLTELEAGRDQISDLDVSDKIHKYNTILQKKQDTQKQSERLELEAEREKTNVIRYEQTIAQLVAKVEEYTSNKEAIENLESLIQDRRARQTELRTVQSSLDKCKNAIGRVQRSTGSKEQKVASLKEERDKHQELREEFAAYDLYMRCMHPNGIAYDVIKKKLPVINQEIAKVLANLTTFEVLFEEDGNKLDILIKHPQHDPRPLSMASGAEKTMAAMAIRLAFLAVSNLPTGDIMVLDEPGTALDEEHLQAFTQLLDMIKSYFKTTLLISHLDSLKDVVDTTLDISKREGFAFVNQ